MVTIRGKEGCGEVGEGNGGINGDERDMTWVVNRQYTDDIL